MYIYFGRNPRIQQLTIICTGPKKYSGNLWNSNGGRRQMPDAALLQIKRNEPRHKRFGPSQGDTDHEAPCAYWTTQNHHHCPRAVKDKFDF